MQLYEHPLENFPSEKARKRPNRHTNSLSRLPNRLAKGGSSYLYESRTRFAAEWNEIHVLSGTSIPWHVGVRKHSHFIDSLSPFLIGLGRSFFSP
uniref:Uncharacterized protein n=1 Tax=Helianthus annuus TaxID=4232 RepID=A0A2P1MA98_HELAN|nr:hypothetical protein [Helianthus annuus]